MPPGVEFFVFLPRLVRFTMIERSPSIPLPALAIAEAARSLEDAQPGEVLAWTLQTYDRVALACSFGGVTGVALLDLAMRLDRSIPVYYLDTGLLFPETYALVERLARRYGIEPVRIAPELSVEEQGVRFGGELWLRDPDACCGLRKIEPQRRFLRGFDAWISGIRRDQTPGRRSQAKAAEKIPRDIRAFHIFRLRARHSQGERRAVRRPHVRRPHQRGEDVVVILKITVARPGKPVIVAFAGKTVQQFDKLPWLLHRKHAQHHGIDQAENRGVGADPQPQRQHCDRGKPRRPPEHPRRVARIPPHRLDPCAAPQDHASSHKLLVAGRRRV